MKYKLPSNHKQIKFLKSLLNTKTAYKGGFIINDDFYSSFKFSKDEINQMLNALNDKKLTEMYPPSSDCPFTWIKISQRAFSYVPDMQDNLFRFWFPILASSGLSVAAIVISIIALCQ